jgi:outer membrane protein assembly factor BamB
VAFANIGQSNVSSLQAFQGSRILRFGALSVNSMGDEVVCLDAATGTKAWSFKLTGWPMWGRDAARSGRM